MSGADASGGPGPGTPVRTTHTIRASAPAQTVYGLLAAAGNWPAVFEPTVFVDPLEHGPVAGGVTFERFRLWATVNGQVVSWSSRRELDPGSRLITFRQEHSTPPIASMSGSWHVEERGAEASDVTLVHEFTTVDGSEQSARWITAALDRNSTAELGQLARLAALDAAHEAGGALVDSFEDVFDIDAPPAAVYEFLDRGDLWHERLPHVEESVLTISEDGAQHLALTTVTPDGDRHHTASTRIRVDASRLAYKQEKTPEILLGHAGLWTIAPLDGGARTRATSRHTFTLRPDALERVLGAGTTVAAARAHMREALGANSRATLEHAAKFAS
ncbi:actinorhodin polyketide synthase bifunctional cyclase/dehydratase [Catenulispora acidiphila DSM 44928]|uniref:Actinorhodin polyketide synthase bifunctional cyclase/dehydratase n=1 Tax=Catenulispora acidiphila (strain DSM 44928 / JCM 14897 / NBRC 102108 / NRRL B-24433 / ID139908) TaxID=479433 RepID=C7PWQ8_CATAD|nr:SRPBCC family protein [Catenulispora acidiphila]ACU75338.1 actinorhodin polyketide synthase bifunctional cyclase/dehydratase [Catenulispora acidiphila DSM 44928]